MDATRKIQVGIHGLSLEHKSMCPGNWVHITRRLLFLSQDRFLAVIRPRFFPGTDDPVQVIPAGLGPDFKIIHQSEIPVIAHDTDPPVIIFRIVPLFFVCGFCKRLHFVEISIPYFTGECNLIPVLFFPEG